MQETPNGVVELTSQELSSVDRFRQLKQTSVLVILFTDIKGFTELTERRGDRFALELLERHDAIVVPAIEEGGAGLVIKHIGDSVMAVFSEPSTAVERALAIQERIRAFRAQHPEFDCLQVRIGLHMGQVAVENRTQLDLFGRHVNRASRVEGMADGGQVFLTYPVFDSARGWLASAGAEAPAWKLHGSFKLKGVEEPVAIYEVADRRFGAPHPPQGGRRSVSLLPLWVGLAVLAVGAGAFLAVTRLRAPEVWFTRWPSEKVLVDQREPLALLGSPSDETRRALTRLAPGRHLLQMDIHWQLRNYMEIDVKRGRNTFEPAFVEDFLPSLTSRLDWEPASPSVDRQEEFSYLLYDRANKRRENKATIRLAVSGSQDSGDADLMHYRISWQVTINGSVMSADEAEVSVRPSNDETTRDEQVLFEDDLQWWYLRWYAGGRSIEPEIGASYIEYKDK